MFSIKIPEINLFPQPVQPLREYAAKSLVSSVAKALRQHRHLMYGLKPVPFSPKRKIPSSYPAVPAATGEIARKCSTASGTTFKTKSTSASVAVFSKLKRKLARARVLSTPIAIST